MEKRSTWDKFNCEFIEQDVNTISFKDIKTITSFGFIEHVNDDEEVLKNMYNMLSEDGVLHIFDLPNKYSINEFLTRTFNIAQDHENLYTKRMIKNKLKEAGFKNIEIKRQYLIPAQLNKVNQTLGNLFDKHYKFIEVLDKILTIPFGLFVQTFTIRCTK